LSYVFSNEGYSHGHALAFTTTLAHEFNKSQFYERFKNIMRKLDVPTIRLKSDLNEAAELIMTDHKHIENNPVQVTKDDIIKLLNRINTEQIFRIS
jgi:succinate semialdehyde reductase